MAPVMTQADAIERFGKPVETGIDLADPIPVLKELQFQGDVAIIPDANTASEDDGALDYVVDPATTLVSLNGVAVVRGENGGNTHLLLPDDGVRFDERTDPDQPLLLGVLTVDQHTAAHLHHPEHGYVGIGTGTYEIRRQREQADEIQLVRD